MSELHVGMNYIGLSQLNWPPNPSRLTLGNEIPRHAKHLPSMEWLPLLGISTSKYTPSDARQSHVSWIMPLDRSPKMLMLKSNSPLRDHRSTHRTHQLVLRAQYRSGHSKVTVALRTRSGLFSCSGTVGMLQSPAACAHMWLRLPILL